MAESVLPRMKSYNTDWKRHPERLSLILAQFIGSSKGFFIGILFILLWITTAPVERFRHNPHEAIMEIVAIMAFVQVFALQRSYTKDMKAIHLKLDEVIGSHAGASNRLIRAEEESEQVLDEARAAFAKYSEQVLSNEAPNETVSIEDIHTGFREPGEDHHIKDDAA